MSVVDRTLVRMPTTPELLDFEARYPRWTPQKGEAIRREMGITEARFFQLLHRAVATHEGQAHDPITAHRVMRRLGRGGAVGLVAV